MKAVTPPASHIRLLRQSRVAEMYMVVYHSRQQEASLCVNLFVTVGSRFSVSFDDFLNLFSFNNHGTGKPASFVYNDCMMYPRTFHKHFFQLEFLGYFLNQLSHFSWMTPNTASPKMLLFILEVPNSRLMKMTGTSVM